jgi:membrane protease subunit (stomatin/prohibitin family)
MSEGSNDSIFVLSQLINVRYSGLSEQISKFMTAVDKLFEMDSVIEKKITDMGDRLSEIASNQTVLEESMKVLLEQQETGLNFYGKEWSC